MSSLWHILLPLLLFFSHDVCMYELRIGSRPSDLAVTQARAVAQTLLPSSTTANPSARVAAKLVEIAASGDRKSGGIQNVPLALRNVDFTGALDDALFRGDIDVAVHSLKDIAPDHRWKHQESFQITCPLPREDPCDVLVGPYRSLKEIPAGTRIGTSSIRRQAQLFSICGNNNIQVINVRGNLDARLAALRNGTVDALILAKSGLKRMNMMGEESCSDIPAHQMLPGACQGIVAAVCRRDESVFWKNNLDAFVAASAERAFLNTLDKLSPWPGRPPLACLMQRDGNAWTFQGLLATPDGSRLLRASSRSDCLDLTSDEVTDIGVNVGRELLERAGEHFFDEDRIVEQSGLF